MSSSAKLSRDVASIEMDPTLYQSMIGSLLYLNASRPNIAFNVGVYARFQEAPKESHLTAIKRIIRYINGTSDYGIWYSRDSNECLAGYSNADWAGFIDDRKSTSDGCFYLGNNLVSWMSKKQNSVSLSMAEAEYIATASCCAQLLWMKKLLHDYGTSQDTMCVFYDNTSAINLSKNLVQHSKSSISRSDTTSFKIWWRKRLCIWSSSPLTTRRQTYLLNLLMARSLRPCVRPSVSISFLEIYLVCEPFCSLLHTCCIGLTCFCLFMFLSLAFALLLFLLIFVSCSVF